jgi:threonylcarbamoyladenosine tRNA methylthiotransferase MtaB
VPPGKVLAQARALVARGAKEIVLTGIHAASYGKDIPEKAPGALPGLVRAVHGLEGLARLRLSSLDPQWVTPDFVRALQGLPRLCPHFHLSLQSGCGATLRRMNRRYGPEGYAACADLLRAAFPGAALTTDVLVGFPGETEAEFAESYAFVRAAGFARLHVFPFSPRAGTAAAGLPGQVPPAVKDSRAQRMLALARELEGEFISGHLSQTLEVLFEQRTGGVALGYGADYLPVRAPAAWNVVNEILPVRVEKNGGRWAEGKILRTPPQ